MSTHSDPEGTRGESENASLTVYRRFGFRFQTLLSTAKGLNDNGHHEAAIVTAQTACEVCTAMVLTEILKIRDIDYLSDALAPTDGLLPNYNLSRKDVRRYYEAVTEDKIAEDDNDRWTRFQKHVRRRNKVVHHAGESATKAEADASIRVVQEMIEHILQHHDAKWRQS
jgi:hypothetical protein